MTAPVGFELKDVLGAESGKDMRMMVEEVVINGGLLCIVSHRSLPLCTVRLSLIER